MIDVLPWLVLFLPLCAAFAIVLLTKSSRRLSSSISVTTVWISFLGSVILFFAAKTNPPSFHWIDLRPILDIPFGFVLDRLSKTMLVLVTGVGALIHVYSLGYMREDKGASRYFASLSFFMFAMLGIVLANNFVMMFIFWELVGVASYLLIGHWFERDAAADAAKKAFITNRIGDFGFMLGILMVWAATGSIVFGEIASNISKITSHPAYLSVAAVFIFCGAVGKSAQFPLHVWLPDAMEGPTPISALIHAATMVAAGVYMLVRVGFLLQPSPTALLVIAWIGTISSVIAALTATQQDDIKKILAYSTISQLGYMITAVGLASGEAAMFHLFTHAFFKALLFLGAGAVIIMLHHEQNIWKMGALGRRMQTTFLTFGVGTLALVGFPPFSGFFSKDAILALAYQRNAAIFALDLFTAFLTAFYMVRLILVVFFGKPRSDSALHVEEASPVMTVPLIILAIMSFIAGFGVFARRFLLLPDEKGVAILVPLLAFATVVLGGGLAFSLYRNRESDPIDAAILRRRFYFDEFYAWLINWTQGLLARVAAFFDRWIIDAGAVRGASGATWGSGALLRLIQVGNLQAYSFLFGLGIVWLIYFTVFR
jgi:NADH-quinone oxidoreductase subunit L